MNESASADQYDLLELQELCGKFAANPDEVDKESAARLAVAFAKIAGLHCCRRVGDGLAVLYFPV